ncbi:MAG: hypothetical protein PHQ62_02430 [Clostridia bacterium]|nr:hypothetical protein [Clostridia bacterium]
MITLNNFLTKIDYEFASIYLKILGYKREKKDTRELEKIITKLAEQGQVESIEYYFSTLSPVTCLNTKIVSNIFKIEKKFVKQPRDFMALHAWKLASGFNKRVENIENSPQNNLCEKYYDSALIMLSKISNIDCIASEYVYKAKNRANKGVEYLREMFNYRNKLYALANKQISEDKKLKYLYAYAKNLIQFAPENEFKNKLNLVNKIIGDLQKNCLVLNVSKNN